MNKKEVSEIRKQFSQTNCNITRIAGCYVDHEKEKKMQTKDAFLSLPEEEAFKYFEIFKKALSGGLGKNLITMGFANDAELPDGQQAFLLKLRASKLQDDALLNAFYDSVIAHYSFAENYYIILIHGMYDIPGQSTDGQTMEDASDEVYEYLLCTICPVSLSKPGLSYDAEDNRMQDRIRDWVVDKPDKGFLFPAFTDRTQDIHNVLYYTKKTSELQPELVEQVLGAWLPISYDDQKESFKAVVSDTLAEKCDFTTVKNIFENLQETVEDHADNPEPLVLDKKDMKILFENSGVPEENMDSFEQVYDKVAGEKTELIAGNIADNKKFCVSTSDVELKVSPDRTDLLETRMIDGRPCLVIALDGTVTVNGIEVRAMSRKEE